MNKTYKLGDLIQECDERNSNLIYGIDDVKGISIQKIFIETKADMQGVPLAPYKLVKPDQFAYVTVTSRNGEKITLAHNTTENTYIVSSTYIVFKISSPELILSDYLFMYFNRPEFDRFSRFNSWGSARETFDWNDLCDIFITLPPLDVQQKYVDIYNAMQKNAASFEQGADDLKLVCDGFIEKLKKDTKMVKIGEFIEKLGKNSDGKVKKVRGIGQNGFISPQKDPNASLKNYKILKKGCICYAPPIYNILSDAIHYYDEDEMACCSPIYETFECDDNYLLAEYLLLWLKRNEFKRYAEFYSLGVRNTFDFNLMKEVQIPLPPLSVQKSIVQIYNVYNKRKSIATALKAQIKQLCPVLIKGSLQGE